MDGRGAETIGETLGRQRAAEHGGAPGHQQSKPIAEIMPGIGEQRDGMRRETVDHFGGDEREVDERGQAEGGAEIAADMCVDVAVRVAVRVAVLVAVIMPMRMIVADVIMHHCAYMEWKATVIQSQLYNYSYTITVRRK